MPRLQFEVAIHNKNITPFDNSILIRIVISLFFTFRRWQARREQDRNMRAGLIPSRALQERRIVHERNELNGDIQANQSSDRPDGTFLLPYFYFC